VFLEIIEVVSEFINDLIVLIDLCLMDFKLLVYILNLLVFILCRKARTSMKAVMSICLVLRTLLSSFALVMMFLEVE
jgi:hypothetical protein